MDAIARLLKRIVPDNIAAILGVIGNTIMPLVKEIVILVLRILGIFYPRFQVMIPKVEAIYVKVEKFWDNIKRFFLDMDPK